MSRPCTNCSTQNEESAAFCDYCGAVLPPPAQPNVPLNRAFVPLGPNVPQTPQRVGATTVCGVCGQTSELGDAFCINCGTPLASPYPSQPATPIPPISLIPPTPSAPPIAPTPQPPNETFLVNNIPPPLSPGVGAATRMLSSGRLVIGDAEIQLPPLARVSLGRQDPYSKPPWHPDVDLTPYGAGDPSYGVSRHHAKLVWTGEWRIEDLASVNGTFVKGQRITQQTLLRDGDQIALGRLVMTFRAN